MKLKYEANKRSRIKNHFLFYVPLEWQGILDTYSGIKEKGISEVNCRSIRAFRRRLKQIPKGVEIILFSRYIGHNVIGYGSK
jgi:hypothetical protein